MRSDIINTVVPYNMSKTLFVISSFISRIVKHKIKAVLVKSLDEALELYINSNSTKNKTTTPNKNKTSATTQQLLEYIEILEQQNENLLKEREENIDKLFTILGRISWDENYKLKINENETNPYYKVYGAAEVLHQDIKQMLTDRDELIKKAHESDRLKTAFLSNLSHEIRTPLNGITGFTSLLLERNNLPDDIKHYLKIIDKSSNNLLHIINNLLDISKLETNQYKINLTNQDINNIFINLKNIYHDKAKEKNLNLKINIDNNPTFVNTDYSALLNILSKLTENAIKFTNTGSIEIGYVNEKQSVKFYVKDTGIGLEKKQQKLIFQNFRQTDEQTIRKYGGTGIGLSIAQGICKLLDCEIFVNSEKNKGSTFYFYLPKNLIMVKY